MKYTSDTECSRRFVIWKDTLPFTYKADRFVCSEYGKNIYLSHKQGSVKLAVEIKNGNIVHNNYALIGGEFRYILDNRFNVKLGETDNSSNKFDTEMTFAKENAFKGCSLEFAKAIIDFDCDNISLPSGNLILNCAAYAEIGSSIRCFEIAYGILIWFLAQNENEICCCEEDIFNLFNI